MTMDKKMISKASSTARPIFSLFFANNKRFLLLRNEDTIACIKIQSGDKSSKEFELLV